MLERLPAVRTFLFRHIPEDAQHGSHATILGRQRNGGDLDPTDLLRQANQSALAAGLSSFTNGSLHVIDLLAIARMDIVSNVFTEDLL